ncbi:uncharacterized protein F5Z01DRAFT_509459 [Emericellopsis atlantica]|uniref:Pyridoxamine phosphate oxidase family protein n=1 Tax=Emericellopsis atlantica TaxID=2614577 RepID=A0A9P7ZQF4_9HYPO|nr:uncharacterized protein F5Z01DRAFT_509459 [Emericellopsis atlantica]KAG9256419.1 hypothetical protein F5Z01DRAFT_509459 [Emericellopsis atlantica]
MKLYPSLSDDLAAWAAQQPVFFTASAPTHAPHINVSPKGQTSSHLAFLTPNRCAYIDRTGSGCETIAHAYENGRLVLMFISFGAAPRILRLFGTSTVVEWDDPRFDDLVRTISKGQRGAFDGARAVVVCDIFQVQTSCGYGVPRVKQALYDPDAAADATPPAEQQQQAASEKGAEWDVFEDRPTMDTWAAKKVETAALFDYQKEKNAYSIDGLPGLKSARRDTGQNMRLVELQAWGARIAKEGDAVAVGFVGAVVLFLFLRFVLGLL